MNEFKHSGEFKCIVEGCHKLKRHRGMCTTHYKRWWRHGDPNKTLLNMNWDLCKVEGCQRYRKSSDGYCAMHWTRVSRYGREHTIRAEHGAGTINLSGYRVFCIKGVHKYEHIIVAELALGKKLPPKAVVHHMNEQPADNFTPYNLIICPNQDYHLLLHRRMKAAARARELGLDVTEALKNVI